MKKIILLISLAGFGLGANAQIVSMTKSEIKALRKDIDTNKNTPSTYKKVYQPFFNAAQKALSEDPNPIEKIQSQGLLEGNPAKTASLKAVEDAYKVYSLALVYRLYGDKSYLDKATTFLLAWGTTNKATGDPINETKLEDMITGYDLVRSELSAENQKTIDDWMGSIAEAQLNSASSKPGRGTAINNWNSHRIKIITLIAYTLHTKKYDDVITTELEKQLVINLNADGTTHDFVERDAFHYHTYDLEPLLSACIAIYRATGKNYFDYETPKGASIKKCVDFMVPYMTGEKTHGEFVNSTVPFDQQRAKNHEKGYEAGTLFKPESGLYTLSLAAYFNPSYLVAIKQTMKNNPDYFNWQLALNSVKKK
jgi:Alginate lyase